MAAVHGVHVGVMPTCGERPCVPNGRSYCACTLSHTCSVRTRTVVSIYGARIVIV